jgi:hypothetical protein
MRVALAVLCIGAVTFLLRVLVALVKDWMRLPPRTAKFYRARFNPSKQPGELIVVDPQAQQRGYPRGNRERMAI